MPPSYPRTSLSNKKWRNLNKGHCRKCCSSAAVHCDYHENFFRENSRLLMEPERSRQNKIFNQYYGSITFCLGIIGFQNFYFSIVFIFWLVFFASKHTKSIEKHKLFILIAPERVKIDMPCKNRKCLILGAFSDSDVSFSH